jgi:hypothetical protein
MAELSPLVPGGGGRRRRKARLSFPKRTDRRTNVGMHEIGGNAQSQAQAGVAASNHRPLITSDPYTALGSHDQRKTLTLGNRGQVKRRVHVRACVRACERALPALHRLFYQKELSCTRTGPTSENPVFLLFLGELN